jgi:hypothetical protein
MLVMNPRSVRFGSVEWKSVAAVVVDRQASRLVEDLGDNGPYVVFADAPEQRVRVKVVQEFARDEMSTPRPGDQATLSFVTSPIGTDTLKRRVAMSAVVVGVDHEISLKRGATRTVTLTAISPDGRADPITIVDTTDET